MGPIAAESLVTARSPIAARSPVTARSLVAHASDGSTGSYRFYDDWKNYFGEYDKKKTASRVDARSTVAAKSPIAAESPVTARSPVAHTSNGSTGSYRFS